MKATHADFHDSAKLGRPCPKRAGIVLPILLLCAPSALAIAASPESNMTQILQLGTRAFTITQTTPNRTPVVPMWKAQTPSDSRKNAAGFPMLKDARHFDVWKPARREEGAFNHCQSLFFYDGRFYAMWANHLHGEDRPGQRILYSTSRDGREWTPPAELFPPPCPMLKDDHPRGIFLLPDRLAVADGKLYAIAYVRRAFNYPIAREIAGGGTLLGEPFLLRDLPSKDGVTAALPAFMPRPRKAPEIASKIKKWYEDNDTASWWSHVAGEGIPNRGVNGESLIEPSTYRSKHGMVLLMRHFARSKDVKNKASNRLYASFPDGKGGWTPPHPTDIPDSHSRAQTLRLPDGRVLLAGNQIAPRFDQGLSLARDPLTLAVSPDGEFFTKVFALRAGAPPQYRFLGITGRSKGFAYPSMVIHDNMIYVLYSVNKEDIAISMVPLDALPANA